MTYNDDYLTPFTSEFDDDGIGSEGGEEEVPTGNDDDTKTSEPEEEDDDFGSEEI